MTYLHDLSNRLEEKRDELTEWMNQKRLSIEVPIYGSVDVRDAGWKIAVVDANQFPAGFNNTSNSDMPHLINRISEHIKRNNPDAEFIYGNCLYFGDKHLVLRKPKLSVDALAYGPLFNGHSPIKISLFKRLGGYCKDLHINADWDFWISIYENNIKGYYLNKTIYKKRYRKNNVGSEFSHLKRQIIKLIIKRHSKFFANKKRKRLAWFNYYEKLARHYKSLGKRIKAYECAKKAMEYGEEIPVFKTIFEEQKMSALRYAIRRLGRLL